MNASIPRQPSRRFVLAAVGSAGGLSADIETACVELGRRAIEVGFRVVTGGLGGVMEAVSRGAHSSSAWREGDVLGVLPAYDRDAANPYVDIVVPTGMQIGRNVVVVAMSDVVVAIGGGAGTLSEIAIAWQLGKPIISLAGSGGWSQRLAGECIDARRRDTVHAAEDAEQAITLALELASHRRPEPRDIASGSKGNP
ncbi:TIGR00725 family protein [Polyangium sp. 6x1]|uniref:TIGR00725 family protein n=1 Tax=Polyangium sp. 6x1 TaxID=3042689 RepID=UPI0024827885|nr:TIGR00725 family protein [Polyangium sp. 6x1]MDI1443606.1 TIGR00725 family protein [Polyangium sp. 6x1]